METMLNVCNVCGDMLNEFDDRNGFVFKRSYIGYGSVHDGECCSCVVCCHCFDKIMGSIDFKIDPFAESGREDD